MWVGPGLDATCPEQSDAVWQEPVPGPTDTPSGGRSRELGQEQSVRGCSRPRAYACACTRSVAFISVRHHFLGGGFWQFRGHFPRRRLCCFCSWNSDISLTWVRGGNRCTDGSHRSLEAGRQPWSGRVPTSRSQGTAFPATLAGTSWSLHTRHLMGFNLVLFMRV